ncbi:hypothetical protein GCM10023093_15690 [Nemorincola caseinilytica]|uniref:Outer membrane protein beta-barrel domain-containing protein n=1 Tax=Nemorincola caseinilytica TaxID=2054315 RepID=A0ABP8NEY4_9BACT
MGIATPYRLMTYFMFIGPREVFVAAYMPQIEEQEEQRPATPAPIAKKDSAKTVSKKWGISLSGGRVRNDATFIEKGSYQFMKQYRDSTDSRINTFNYSLGLRYIVSAKLRLHAAAGITRTGERMNTRQVVYKVDSVVVIGTNLTGSVPPIVRMTSATYYDIGNDSTGHLTNTLTYATFSAGLTCSILSLGHLDVGLQPSFTFNRLMRHNYHYFNDDSVMYFKAGRDMFATWVASAGLGLVAEYRISPSFSIALTPHYNRFIAHVYARPQATETRYGQASLNLSATWWFR